MAETLMATAMVASAISSGYQMHQSDKALEKQENAQEKAQQKQQEADDKAERARLEALAKNQEDQNIFDFGIDSTLAKRYADAAQKWGAGTGSMTTDDDNENPFYTRGLI